MGALLDVTPCDNVLEWNRVSSAFHEVNALGGAVKGDVVFGKVEFTVDLTQVGEKYGYLRLTPEGLAPGYLRPVVTVFDGRWRGDSLLEVRCPSSSKLHSMILANGALVMIRHFHGMRICGRWRNQFLLASVFLICCSRPFLALADPGGEIPGLRGLPSNQIIFAPMIGVETANSARDTKELNNRAILKLSQAGIALEGVHSETEKKGRAAQLVLTFLARKIDGCKDKLIYMKNLELLEDAVRQREPKVSMTGAAFGGPLSVEVIGIDEAVLERFGRDIDRLLDMFISAYRSSN